MPAMPLRSVSAYFRSIPAGKKMVSKISNLKTRGLGDLQVNLPQENKNQLEHPALNITLSG